MLGISGVLINTEEEMKRELSRQKENGGRIVFLTGQPSLVKILVQRNLPVVYLEEMDGEPVYEAEYVWRQDPEEDLPFLPEEEDLEKIWRRRNKVPWIIAETQRLLIRESIPEDLPAFLCFYEEERANADVGLPGVDPEGDLEMYIRTQYRVCGYGLWTVLIKDTGEVIGRLGVEMGEEAQFAYLIGRKYRRQGYALEAMKAVQQYVKEEYPGLSPVVYTSRENEASWNLAAKLGVPALLID